MNDAYAMGKVWFVGAGPGDPELITLKGHRIVCRASLVLYAGSLVPREVVAAARPDARVEDSASMTLEETHALMLDAVRRGGEVARVHTGDPSLYGAVMEQARLLAEAGVPFGIVPGVTSACAAAAAARVSFTMPEAVQSLVVTRLSGRTPVPEAESLESFAAHGCSLAIYLSATMAAEVADRLMAGGLPADTAVVAAHKVGHKGERIVFTVLGELAAVAAKEGFSGQTVFLVLPGESSRAVSRLYDAGFAHGRRPGDGR